MQELNNELTGMLKESFESELVVLLNKYNPHLELANHTVPRYLIAARDKRITNMSKDMLIDVSREVIPNYLDPSPDEIKMEDFQSITRSLHKIGVKNCELQVSDIDPIKTAMALDRVNYSKYDHTKSIYVLGIMVEIDGISFTIEQTTQS